MGCLKDERRTRIPTSTRKLDLDVEVAHDASMTDEWRELAVFMDRASAEVLAGLLRSESIDARVVADEPVPGLIRSITVSVPVAQFGRARELYADAPLSEEEWTSYMDRGGKHEEGNE